MLALGIALQVAVVAAAPETVMVRQPFTVVVTVSAPTRDRPVMVPPRVEPFRLLDVRRRPIVDTTRAWATWRSAEWRYTLVPPAVGRYVLAPFEARAGGTFGRSLPKEIVVVQERARPMEPAIVGRAPVDTARGVAFHALVLPDTVWVGQQATYQVGVFLEDGVRLRLRRNPEFVPPELRAMLAYDLTPGAQAPAVRRIGSRRYEVHVFQRALFPLSAGRHVIPSARLVYALPLSSSFFSREESHTARSESRVIVARDVPEAGRPNDWHGAVGALSVRTRLDASTARVGDPLLLTVRVAGRGNVKLLPRPRLAIPWASVVDADERVHVDSVPSVVQGSKEFDFIVTPRSAGAQSLPGVRYPVFNPYSEQYEILVTAPESLGVAPGTLAADPGAKEERALLPLRPTLRVTERAPAHERSWFWVVAAAAPLPALLLAFVRRPRRVRRVTAAQRLQVMARPRGRGTPERPTPALLRKTYARALADRIGLSAAILTERGELAHAMRRAGVTPETAREAAEFLGELNDAAWAGQERASADAAERAVALYGRVDVEARPDPRRPLAGRAATVVRGMLLSIAVVGLGATAWAATVPDDAARALFGRASALYAERRAPEAARLFGVVAERVPASADAWANRGTAAWTAGDTTEAVVGWQRAMRLQPTALDLRSNLALVEAPRAPFEAMVPPYTSGAAALAALLSWCAAWACAGLSLHRRAPSLRAWGIGAGVFAALAAVGAVAAEEAARARHVVVLDAPTLRGAPALGAEAVPGDVARGTLARLSRRQGAWLHVQLGDGREGWVADEDARSLAR